MLMRRHTIGQNNEEHRIPGNPREMIRMAEVAVSRQMFADILSLIAGLRAPLAGMMGLQGQKVRTTMGKVRLNEGKPLGSSVVGGRFIAFAAHGSR
jgi:hypothetical protein